jgi:hypothetical protein
VTASQVGVAQALTGEESGSLVGLFDVVNTYTLDPLERLQLEFAFRTGWSLPKGFPSWLMSWTISVALVIREGGVVEVPWRN